MALIDENGNSSPTSTSPGTPNVPGDNTVTEDLEPGFTFQRDEVRLLPFHTRVQKLVTVTGLAADDPLFDQLYRSRYDLGDHNYGQGVGPELSWNATKIGLWVRVLRPVCASDAFATRYDLPSETALLMSAAYGRTPGADEVDAIVQGVAGLDEAGTYEAVCLAVLTSAEFVAQ